MWIVSVSGLAERWVCRERAMTGEKRWMGCMWGRRAATLTEPALADLERDILGINGGTGLGAEQRGNGITETETD